jgi:hypothetical protein
MNESRFKLDEFFVKLELETFSRAGANWDYHHTLYDVNAINKGSYNISFEPVAMKEEGLCYTMQVPLYLYLILE